MRKVEYGNIVLDYRKNGNQAFWSNNSGYINIVYVVPQNIRLYDEILSYTPNESLRILQSAFEDKVSHLLKYNNRANILVCDELGINIPIPFVNVELTNIDFDKYSFYKENIKAIPNIKLYCTDSTKKLTHIIRVKRYATLFNPLFNYFKDGNERVLDDHIYTKQYETIESNYPFSVLHLTDFVLKLDFKEPTYDQNIDGKSVIGNGLSGLYAGADIENRYNTTKIDSKLNEIDCLRSSLKRFEGLNSLPPSNYYINSNSDFNSILRQECDVARIAKEQKEYFYLNDTVELHICQYQKDKDRVGINSISFPTDFLETFYPIYSNGKKKYIQERKNEMALNKKQIKTNTQHETPNETSGIDYNINHTHNKDSKIVQRDSHYYLNDWRLLGVTNIVANFFPKFDADYWAGVKAPLIGKSKEQLLKEWEIKGVESAKAGTKLHERIDAYYHNKEIATDDKDYSLFMQFANAYRLNPYRSEWAVYDEDTNIVGVVDMLDYSNGEYILYDWKRSDKIVEGGQPIKENKFDEYGLRPIDKVPNTDYWHYALQLSFYRYILEKNYGIRVKESRLVVLHPSLNLPVVLTVPYMIDEVNKIIEVIKMN